MKTYAGIGSRRAPDEILGLCSLIGGAMRRHGWILRSGHAIGCDQAFEFGARDEAEVYLPWKDYEADHELLANVAFVMPTIEAIQMVPKYHPAPMRLSMSSIRLLARNCHILLGPGLDMPVDRVICWTEDEERGGTSFGLRIARELGITVDNLADPVVHSLYEDLCLAG